MVWRRVATVPVDIHQVWENGAGRRLGIFNINIKRYILTTLPIFAALAFELTTNSPRVSGWKVGVTNTSDGIDPCHQALC